MVFDTSQYTPKKWMNRNKILNISKEWQYITVPLSNSSININTFEAKILSLDNTFSEHLDKLKVYKGKDPHYKNVIKLFEDSFCKTASDYLVDLNISSLKNVCDYLDIEFHFVRASKLDIKYPDNLKPDDGLCSSASI
ncbi:WbqC family protein [Prochlorococcus sp. AH-736-B04]|nr:WbqC family protein [Prochlorococcus sp. AH-736-B04]